MTSVIKGNIQIGNGASNFNLIAPPADGSYFVADSTQTLGYNTRVASPAPGSQSYSLVTLAFNTARTPNTVNNTLVVITVGVSLGLGQNSTVNAIVNTTTISSQVTSNSLTLALGSLVSPVNFTFIVPANSSYKITSSGSGTNTISSIYELTI